MFFYGIFKLRGYKIKGGNKFGGQNDIFYFIFQSQVGPTLIGVRMWDNPFMWRSSILSGLDFIRWAPLWSHTLLITALYWLCPNCYYLILIKIQTPTSYRLDEFNQASSIDEYQIGPIINPICVSLMLNLLEHA